jgi:CheY-like chemotaxis protein
MRPRLFDVPTSSSDAPKAVVLAIDDDPATIADLVRILGAGGYSCHCCRDMASAAEQFAAVRPNLIIADLGLAGPNGRLLSEALHGASGFDEAPRMFLAQSHGADVVHRPGPRGGVYYVRKPLNVVVLLELVDKALWKPQICAVR